MDRSQAVDATGLAQVAAGTFLVRRMHLQRRPAVAKRHGLKWLTAVDRQLILAIFF